MLKTTKRDWRFIWQRKKNQNHPNQNQPPKINQDTQQAVDVLTIMYVVVILPTWLWIENPDSHWLVNDMSYVFRSVMFPFMLYLLCRDTIYKLLIAVALLGVFSTLSDYELIDQYDTELLFIKMALTLYAMGLIIKKHTKR